MFGFGKKKKQSEEEIRERGEKKKGKSRTDKLIMGAIVGVAVGSVIGISMKGKNEHEQKEEQKKLHGPIPGKVREPRSRIGRFFRRLLRRKKNREPVHPGKEFKKIPNEWE